MATATDNAALRMRAIESLLVDKGLLTQAVVDRIANAYEHDIGPMRGARIVARAWRDPEFKARLLADGTKTMASSASADSSPSTWSWSRTRRRHTPRRLHAVLLLPLGRPRLAALLVQEPEYRSRAVREPRKVLAEFGVQLPEETEIRIWDSSSEVRYLVLPMPPPALKSSTRRRSCRW
jgi:nitrile hydratase